jgi:hypothetical protein
MHSGFIVTNHMGDLRSGTVASYAPGYSPPKGSVTGRVSTNTGEMFISVKAALDWCKKNDVSYNEMKSSIASKGWLKEVKYFRIGTGTDMHTPAARCLYIDTKSFGHLKLVAPIENNEKLEEAV